MFKIFRWQGIVAFAAVAGLAAAFWMIVIDGLVHRGVEKAGTSVVGAKVELSGADVSFFPLGVELRGLQVTDPDEPMTNAFEAGRMAFNLDPGELVFRRVIINEMSIEGMRFGTERKTSGALEKRKKESGEKKEKSRVAKEADTLFSSVKMPDVKEILEKEQLRTVELSDKLQKDIKQKEEAWKKRIDELPDEKKIKGYEKRAKEIEKLAKAGFPSAIEAAARADKLQKDIDADLKSVKRAEKDLKNDLKALEADLKALKNAPSEDFNRLKNKYGLTSGGAINVSRVLLGPVVTRRLEQVLYLWEKYGVVSERVKKARAGQEKRPERGKGINVTFPERRPLPRFLVYKAAATAEYRGSSFGGKILNICFNQPVLGRPMTFEFSGETLEWANAATVEGSIDRTKPETPVNTFKAVIQGYETRDLKLSGGGALPVEVSAGSADIDFNAVLKEGALDVRADTRMSGLSMVLSDGGKSLGSLSGPVSDALGRIKTARVSATARGSGSNYDLKITSDVDDQLRSAVEDVFREQAREFQQRLQAGVREQTDQYIKEAEGQLDGLRLKDAELDRIDEQLNGMLSEISVF